MKEVVIGIDIGGTNTVYGIVDKQGNCLIDGNIATTDYHKVGAFIDALHQHIETSLQQLPGIVLRGIGVGAPNGNYYNGTIEHPPNLPWKGVINLIKLFKEHFDVPCYVTNDANAAAMGEMIYGAAKDMKDFVVVTLGTGVGSGFVANGELIYGHDGFGGELGHTIVQQNGRECNCGRKGCLETYASVSGIVRTTHIMLAESSKPSVLRDIPAKEITGKLVTDAARNGDPLALEIFDYTAQWLGFSLANTIAITSPEAIILFGGLAQAGDLLIQPVKQHLQNNLLNIFEGKTKVIPSGLNNNNAAILGASALAWQELKKVHNDKIKLN